jgi:hypothetical protein
MGTRFAIIVDCDATDADMEAAAQKAINWLAQKNVILPDLTACILSFEKKGYAPGQFHWQAFQDKSESQKSQLFQVSTNGLEVTTKRHVSLNNQGDFAHKKCTNCGQLSESMGADDWNAAATNWFEYKSDGDLVCEHCGFTQTIAKWEHIDPIGFGNLSFTFWNWPPLSPAFIAEFSQMLNHKTLLIEGKV